MSKTMRKFLGLLLCLSLVLSGMAAQAGSLSMSVESAKAKGLENLAGVQFELFRIGQPNSGAESAWAPVSPFDGEGGVTLPAGTVGKDGKATWTAEQIDAIIGQADDVITKKSVEGTIKSTDATGKVEFTDLDAGVYYVRKVENTQPLRLTVKPFLVTIPSLSEQNPEDINFDLSAQGKMDYETPGEKTVSVEKKWEDHNNFDGIRPPEVTVHLKRTYTDHFTGNEVTEDSDAADATVKLNEGNDWSYEWKGLPDSNYDKAPYTYSVVEDEVPGYEIEITGGEEAGFTITNTHTPKYGAIELTKNVTVDGKAPAGEQLNYADGVYHFTITGPTDADYAALGIKKVEKDPNDAKKVYNYLDAETFDITITGGEASTWGKDKLVPGTYTIVETGKDDGELPEGMSLIGDSPLEVVVVEGTTAESPTTAELTNNQETGKLIIEKKVLIGYDDASKSGDPTLADGDYKFTVTGDANGQQYTKEVTITIKNGESNTAEVNNLLPGKYTITEDTRNLPEGVELVSENLPEGYTAPVDDALKVTVEAGKEAEVKVATFVNNRAVGALAINKIVDSDAAADHHDKAFTFTLTLDQPINGTFDANDGKGGTITFEDGVATFELEDGDGVYIYGLPAGAHYTVTEESVDDFTTTWEAEEVGGTEVTEDGVSGVILDINAEEEVPFITIDVTNTRDTGDLVVSKELISDAAADKDQEFTFTITLDDKTITGEYGDVEFKDGVATVTLKGGESKTAEGLPIGVGYTITEEEAEGFQQTGKTGDTGTISKTEAKAEITNTRDVGDLEVKKVVVSSTAADKQKEFSFTVTLSDETIEGEYGDMTFAKGEATFKLKDGEVKTAKGLPTGIIYKVEEEADGAFVTTKTGDTGTISTTKSIAVFTNTKKEGGLIVSKTVMSDLSADHNKAFSFTVELSDKTINGTYGEMTFENGVATFELKDGESKKTEGLPDGVKYTVTESDEADFTVKYDGETGTIKENETAACSVTNARKVGELEVMKAVESSTTADLDKLFTIKVTLDNEEINGTYGDMEFAAGVATFQIKSEDIRTASNLPIGLKFTVEETDGEGFNVSYEEADNGIISVTKAEVLVVNDRKEGDLKVEKKVESDLTADKTKAFSFTVTLDDETINDQYADMTFEDGVATFELKDGESAIAEGLPAGVGYTVEETDEDGFTTTWEGETGGTIVEDEIAEVKAINTRDVGDLELNKVLVSDAAADKDQEFTFTVTLSEKLSKTYGDMEFKDGVATIKLKGGDKKTATNLPVGITYTITEAEAEGFKQTGKTGDTGTISTTKSEATFTNTREVGDLEVKKVVVSSTAADKQKNFNFTVTLSDSTINKTFGDMEFKAGVATFKLTDGQTATAEGLPTGITYKVEEEADGAFVTTKTGDTGTISTTKSTAVFTNTKKEGDLVVSKTVVSDLEADHNKEFSFTVKLDDNTINGTYGEMTFENGVATFKLKDKGSIKAEGLPDGVKYTVTESDEADFTVKYDGETGTIKEGETAACSVTNPRKTGDLVVKKTVVTQTTADKSLAFDFTVTLSDTTLSKTYGGMVFKNGVAEFSLKNGETKTATGLPIGITYTVTEEDANGFELTGKTGDTGTISTTKCESEFTNTRTTGGLAIKKRVTVNGQSTTTSTLADGTYRFNIVGPNNYKGTASIKIENGKSDYAYIDDLEPGTYTVSEVTTGLPNRVSLSGGNNKKVTVVAGMQGSELVTFDKNPTKTTAETNALQAGMADFLNAYTTPPPGGPGNTPTPTPYVTETPEPTPTPTPEPTPTPVTSLSGQKQWNDESNTHRTRPATITVQLLRDGVVVSSNTVRGSSNTWRFTFNNLPAVDENGTPYSYSIRESGVTGYTTTVNGTTIVNDLIPRTPQNYTNINGTKTWNDDNNSAGDRPNYITVRLLRDGREIERRTVTAANGWQYSFTNLPVDDGYGNIYSYSIREDAVPGYFARTNGYDLTNTRLPDEPVTMIDYDTPLAGLQEEELEDLVDLFDYGTPLWGELLKTGDETPIYPFIFGGVGVAALAALILLTVFGKKKKEEGA